MIAIRRILCREGRQHIPIFLVALIAWMLMSGCSDPLERRWDEEQALASVMLIRVAEQNFRSKSSRYGTLKDLAEAGLINSQLASGEKHGYRFELSAERDSFVMVAFPLKYPRNQWSLYLDQ